MHGFIIIKAQAGRALRRQRATLSAADVLDASGAFRAGDAIQVVVRGSDGGQNVLAHGVAACSLQELQEFAPASTDAHASLVVIREQDLELQWPPTR